MGMFIFATLRTSRQMVRTMRIIEVGNKHFRVNGELEIMQEVYWNETFEEWTPVLWEQEMEI